MSGDQAVIFSCEIVNGYMLKNFFNHISIRARPVVTFLSDRIVAANCSADKQIYGTGYLHGDEINLTWSDQIPMDQRKLSLTFDSGQNTATFGGIKKKDEARLIIAQDTNVNGDKSFTIFISTGDGGDRREGVQVISAQQVKPEEYLLSVPDPIRATRLSIPIQDFRKMFAAFGKCKKQQIRLSFFPNNQTIDGMEHKGFPGITVKTDMAGGGRTGPILEKYGEVPNNSVSEPSPPVNYLTDHIDERSIVRVAPTDFQLVLIEEDKDECNPNEFVFDSDKIGIFSRLATMHNEGSVRIFYQPGCNLRIAFRYGGFGEGELYLSNKFVRVLKI